MARRCKGKKSDGARCKAPEHLVDADTGFCAAHAPGASERMAERGRKGAEATRKRFHEKTIDPDTLPPLRSHRDASRWLEIIGRAVVSGDLAHRDAIAAARILDTWLKSEAGRLKEEEIEELRDMIEKLKTGDNPKVRKIS